MATKLIFDESDDSVRLLLDGGGRRAVDEEAGTREEPTAK